MAKSFRKAAAFVLALIIAMGTPFTGAITFSGGKTASDLYGASEVYGIEAPSGDVTVYVTMSVEGELKISKNGTDGIVQLPITVSSGATEIDVIKTLHKLHHENGESAYSEYGGYFSKFWGVETYNIGYFNNGLMVMSPGTVSNGDYIDATVYQNYETDIYTRFSEDCVTVKKDTPVELTLYSNAITKDNWTGGMMAGETANIPCTGVAILVGDETSLNIPYDDSQGYVTDLNGKVTVQFDTPGTYYLAPDSSSGAIIPAICKVVVLNEINEEEAQAVVDADKASLTFDLIKGKNTSQSAVASKLAPAKTGLSGKTTITWTSSNTSVISNSGEVTRPSYKEGDKTVTLNAVIEYLGKTAEKDITVTVMALDPQPVDVSPVITSMAAAYATKDTGWWSNSSDWWHVAAMTSYGRVTGDTVNIIGTDAVQAYTDKTIESLAAAKANTGMAASTYANTLANTINAMSALGYDANSLWTVARNRIKAGDELNRISLDAATQGWYSTVAPYAMIALNQGTYASDEQEDAYVAYMISELSNPSNWAYGADTPGMIMQGLAPYYDRPEAAAVLDAAVTSLSAMQFDTGSLGNNSYDSCGDAMAILALTKLGINPDTDTRFIKNGKSLIDGILSYQTEADFGNDYANKQVLLALTAYEGIVQTGIKYNAFDFSYITPKVAAYAGSTSTAPTTPPPSNDDISVKISVKTHEKTWIPQTTVTVKEGSTVYNAFIKIIEEKGFSQTGASSGYVSSITNAGGETLSEYDKGPNSGWLFKVNGTVTSVGLKEKTIAQGDRIEWYYTVDWTKDQDAVKAAGGSAAIKEETVTTGTAVDVSFTDTEGNWAKSYIEKLASMGILEGMGDGIFAPNSKVTRCQFIQIIAKMAGADLEAYAKADSGEFSDISESAWYKAAALWAYENGIIKGRVNADGSISFAADEEISRQDMAVMLTRYVENYLKRVLVDTSDEINFVDDDAISEYAKEAVAKMQKSGVINGKGNDMFAPWDSATRAEMAKMVCIIIESL